jgi:asparagine synthase (glutamine-hydrolysing)
VLADVQPLAAGLAHRGPDGEGLWLHGSVGLAHRRLAIIDVAGGRQPLLAGTATAPVALVANGEIYNYKHLQVQAVAGGATLQTQSDCEPLVHLFAQHGVAALAELQGMYAVALYDGASGDVWLAVDPFGIKPLYMAETEHGVAWASEPAALAAAGWGSVQRDDLRVMPELLNRHYSTGTATLWAGITRLLPGERRLIQQGRVVATRVQPRPLAPARAAPSDVATFGKQLTAAVERHLVADVPYGLLLSGGLDSTSVMLAMQRLGAPVVAYTAVMEGAANEATTAARLCEKLGAEHVTVPYGPADFWAGLDQLAQRMDDVCTDYAALPLLKLTATARQRVKILLSGEGGDELLAGYGSYRRREDGLRAVLAWWKARRAGDVAPYAKLFKNAAALRAPALTVPFPMDGFTPLQRTQARDIANWLPHDLLLKLDRTTMANGIEGRVPLLDDTFAAYAFALPDAAKVRDGFGKYILREHVAQAGAAQGVGSVTEELAWARKQGFSVPVARLLATDVAKVQRWWEESTLLHGLLRADAGAWLLRELQRADCSPKLGNLCFSLTLLARREGMLHTR